MSLIRYQASEEYKNCNQDNIEIYNKLVTYYLTWKSLIAHLIMTLINGNIKLKALSRCNTSKIDIRIDEIAAFET